MIVVMVVKKLWVIRSFAAQAMQLAGNIGNT